MKVALIAIIFAASMAYAEKPKPQSTPNTQSSAKPTQQPGAETCPSVVVVNQNAANGQQANHPDKSQSYLHELLLPQNIPSIALVGVGIAGIWVAICTLTDIQRQTGHLRRSVIASRKSARAALLNAQAVINSERPWIIIEFQKIMASDHAGKAQFHIVAVNRGKTVARIISYTEPIEVSCVLPDRELPMPYPSNLGHSRPQRFLAPGATMEIADFYPRSRLNMQRMAAAGESQGGNIAAQRMVIYGEIRYSDGVSPEPKWSRYCFQHNPEQFSNIGGNLMFCGPDGYNDYT